MTWIQTYTGRKFDLLNPDRDAVCIKDIAHALSLTCRFSGHCSFHYSVAQHSVIISDLADPGWKLWGLLHDAAEAYVADMPSPLKQLIPGYRAIEQRVLAAIAAAFDLDLPIPYNIKTLDMLMVVTEAEQLLGPPPEPWALEWLDPLEIELCPMTPHEAEDLFLKRFYALT